MAFKKTQGTGILDVAPEKITREKFEDSRIRRHTKWIAISGGVPIVKTLFGTYLNPHCHVLEAYSMSHLQSLNN